MERIGDIELIAESKRSNLIKAILIDYSTISSSASKKVKKVFNAI